MELKIKIDGEFKGLKLDGTCMIDVKGEIIEFNINDVVNKNGLILNIAKESFGDEKSLLIREVYGNKFYKKDNFIREVISAIDSNQVIICEERRIGKSRFINNLAQVYNLPVVVNRECSKINYDNAIDIFSKDENFEGKFKVGDTVLVDDVFIKDVDKLRKMGLNVVGFARVQRLY
ncbi:MAG: hypothetical protein ACRCTZ_13865 [Sarcina sp.]